LGGGGKKGERKLANKRDYVNHTGREKPKVYEETRGACGQVAKKRVALTAPWNQKGEP